MTPLLALLLVAAYDFGRVFYYAMAVTGAADAGAHWGSTSLANSQNTAGMVTIAQNHAPGLGVTASAATICRCGSGTAQPTNLPCHATCAGSKRTYASVTATRTFTTVVNYPGLPSNVTITRNAQMRSQ